MRLRLRHIHIPDLPPVYAPRLLPFKVRDFIQDQIVKLRSLRNTDVTRNLFTPDKTPEVAFRPFAKPVPPFLEWLQEAGPPPTVLSFTRRPTYIIPKHQLSGAESWQSKYFMQSLKAQVSVKFPEPPGWSPLPWRPSSAQQNANTESKLDPLKHVWSEAGQLIMPCAEAMYQGPGQVQLWPIMDLNDEVQRGSKRFRTKYEYERLLEDTTIEVLMREYGIEGFSIPSSPGVWVQSRIPPPELEEEEQLARSEAPSMRNKHENVRRIATIHASITNDITQWGVSIHVGQPDHLMDYSSAEPNPWMPLRQHKITTSIAAELAHIGVSPRHDVRRKPTTEVGTLKKTPYLQTYFNKDAPHAGSLFESLPYSLVKLQSGRRESAPMGMDNRDLSTAWAYEFARQLGMRNGFVDHYGVVDQPEEMSTKLPARSPRPGFRARSLADEEKLTWPYVQVEVPSVRLDKDASASPEIIAESLHQEASDGNKPNIHKGWALSWPLWYETLTTSLDQSISGRGMDTRLRTHDWDKRTAAQQMRRKESLKQVKELEQQWRGEPRQLIRRPLTDRLVQELANKTLEIERVLEDGPIRGTDSEKLLDNTKQLRRMLNSRFATRSQNTAETRPPLDSNAFADLLADYNSERGLPAQAAQFDNAGDTPKVAPRSVYGVPGTESKVSKARASKAGVVNSRSARPLDTAKEKPAPDPSVFAGLLANYNTEVEGLQAQAAHVADAEDTPKRVPSGVSNIPGTESKVPKARASKAAVVNSRSARPSQDTAKAKPAPDPSVFANLLANYNAEVEGLQAQVAQHANAGDASRRAPSGISDMSGTEPEVSRAEAYRAEASKSQDTPNPASTRTFDIFGNERGVPKAEDSFDQAFSGSFDIFGAEINGAKAEGSKARPPGPSRGRYVKFTETGFERFRKWRRKEGIEKAEQRRTLEPDALSARPATPGGKRTFLPRTKQL